jgi:hypothetical protein
LIFRIHFRERAFVEISIPITGLQNPTKRISDIFVRGLIKASLGNGGRGERFEAAFDGSFFLFTSFVPDSQLASERARAHGRENPD